MAAVMGGFGNREGGVKSPRVQKISLSQKSIIQ